MKSWHLRLCFVVVASLLSIAPTIGRADGPLQSVVAGSEIAESVQGGMSATIEADDSQLVRYLMDNPDLLFEDTGSALTAGGSSCSASGNSCSANNCTTCVRSDIHIEIGPLRFTIPRCQCVESVVNESLDR